MSSNLGIEEIDDVSTLLEDEYGQMSCEWHGRYCSERAEYKIVYILHDRDDEVDVFCGRHYALELAHLTEVWIPQYKEELAEYVRYFGPL